MLRTISIKLNTDTEQSEQLLALQTAYADACNALVPAVIENRCWNRVALHKLAYYDIRAKSPLGSQMVCNAIFTVCKAYKAQAALKRIKTEIPALAFDRASVHFDKRTYSIKDGMLSLYTLSGRIKVPMVLGDFQRVRLEPGSPKEAELVFRNGTWFFNLVLETQAPEVHTGEPVLGVDVGENNLAATSTGKLFGGGDLRDRRDRFLALRTRLQSNGSASSRQLLRKISGREARRVKLENHRVSKAIVLEAQRIGASTIALEDLTNIRENIKGGRRIRTRLHRWAFRQLQTFVAYKAQSLGLDVIFVDPAYSSQSCSLCGEIGLRQKHLFSCSCGFRAHADCNAARNLARIAERILSARVSVNAPDVAA
ncbi:MAG: transposase [Deltaproteobacteria bacterium]|jgi:IS605 OrfB family transposase|nr:transposase [Deltaproteobacteria bacterium]